MKHVQEEFRNYLPELEQSINNRLGTENAVSVSAERFVSGGEAGTQQYLSVITEHSEQPLKYDLIFHVENKDIANTRGREVLTVIWQEFYKYLGRFDAEDIPVPNFNNGNDFIRKVSER